MDHVVNILLPQKGKAQDISQARCQLEEPTVKNAVAKPVTLIAGQNVQILRTISVGPPLQPTKQLAPVQLLNKQNPASTATLLLHKGTTPSILRRGPLIKTPNDPLDLDPPAITKPSPKIPLIIKPPPMSCIPKKFTPCFRLVDLDVLAQCLWCDHCQQPLSLKNCIKDHYSAFHSFLLVKCYACPSVYKIPLSRVTDEGSYEAYASDEIISSKINALGSQCATLKKKLNSLKIPQKSRKSVVAYPPATVARRIIYFCMFKSS
jgi:hypothetical protein